MTLEFKFITAKPGLSFSSPLVFELPDGWGSIWFLSMSSGPSPKFGFWSVLEHVYGMALKRKFWFWGLRSAVFSAASAKGWGSRRCGYHPARSPSGPIPSLSRSGGGRQLTADFLPGTCTHPKDAASPEVTALPWRQPASSIRSRRGRACPVASWNNRAGPSWPRTPRGID